MPPHRRRWLYVSLVCVSLAFVWVFNATVKRAHDAGTATLSMEHSPKPLSGPGLQMTPTLGDLPPAVTESERALPQPAPWWAALLFGLAFLAGWLYRHFETHAQQDAPAVVMDHTPSTSTVVNLEARIASVAQSIREGEVPDLSKDFPWDETALENHSGLTSEQRIARLEKQNASKAEIIKALETLVTENREKWLHQDETEARLNRHIEELSDDLRVAIKQLQRLQADQTATSRAHKNAV